MWVNEILRLTKPSEIPLIITSLYSPLNFFVTLCLSVLSCSFEQHWTTFELSWHGKTSSTAPLCHRQSLLWSRQGPPSFSRKSHAGFCRGRSSLQTGHNWAGQSRERVCSETDFDWVGRHCDCVRWRISVRGDQRAARTTWSYRGVADTNWGCARGLRKCLNSEYFVCLQRALQPQWFRPSKCSHLCQA